MRKTRRRRRRSRHLIKLIEPRHTSQTGRREQIRFRIVIQIKIRKYLIARPDPAILDNRPNCRRVEITQAYLHSEIPGETIRIRQRGRDSSYVYFKTRKRSMDDKRIEMEERLTSHEFRDLLMQADPTYRTIRKDRWCLSENGLYYNIDLYPQWNDRALLAVELYSAGDEVRFPEGTRMIREVTGDKEFTNPYIARNQQEGSGR